MVIAQPTHHLTNRPITYHQVGVDLVADLSLDGPTRIRFFLAEVQGAIADAKGDDVASTQAAIQELQEIWELSEDMAETQFVNLVNKKVQEAGNNAARFLSGKRDAQCLKALQDLVAFVPFAAETPKLDVESDRVAKELVNMYKASIKEFGSEELPEGGQEKVDLLKEVFAVEGV